MFSLFAILNKRRSPTCDNTTKRNEVAFSVMYKMETSDFQSDNIIVRLSHCKYTPSFVLFYLELVSGLGVSCLLLWGSLVISDG